MTRGLSMVLAVIACLVLPVAAVSTWLQLQVVDEGHYIDAVAPLGQRPAIQSAAAGSIEQAVRDAVGLDLGDSVNDAFDSGVQKLVATDTFAAAWKAGNRSAHQELLDVLRGGRGNVVDDQGAVRVDLAQLAQPLADSLGIGELTGGARVGLSLELASADDLARARQGFRVVDALGYWPLVAWVILALGSLLLPGARRRAVMILAVGSLLAAGLLAGGLSYARSRVVGHADRANSALVGAVWDVLAHSLWVTVITIAVVSALALVVTLVLSVILPRRRAPG